MIDIFTGIYRYMDREIHVFRLMYITTPDKRFIFRDANFMSELTYNPIQMNMRFVCLKIFILFTNRTEHYFY